MGGKKKIQFCLPPVSKRKYGLQYGKPEPGKNRELQSRSFWGTMKRLDDEKRKSNDGQRNSTCCGSKRRADLCPSSGGKRMRTTLDLAIPASQRDRKKPSAQVETENKGNVRQPTRCCGGRARENLSLPSLRGGGEAACRTFYFHLLNAAV